MMNRVVNCPSCTTVFKSKTHLRKEDTMMLPGLSVFGLYIVLIVFLVLMILFVAGYLCTTPYPEIIRLEGEKTYFLGKDKKESAVFPFGKFAADDAVDLSVIVPAYNEEERLPSMLSEAVAWLEQRRQRVADFSYELLVVDDGSCDGTSRVALQYTDRLGPQQVRVLTLQRNRGKGGAIRLGMLSARGRRLLFADADGATRFSDLHKLETALDALLATSDREDGAAIVCGSRAHLERESMAQRSLFRTLLMKGFHLVVRLFAVRSISDTQCGFKLLTRPAMLLCFANLHVERWAFDAEMLYIAEQMKIPLSEVAVKWTEIAGSKLTPIFSWIEMGTDLFLIWVRYLIGVWRLRDHLDVKKAE